jgi:hypothetical protein
MAEKIVVKRNTKKHNEFKLTGTLTAGEIMAIRHALEVYQERSPVAADCFCYFRNATIVEGNDILEINKPKKSGSPGDCHEVGGVL